MILRLSDPVGLLKDSKQIGSIPNGIIPIMFIKIQNADAEFDEVSNKSAGISYATKAPAMIIPTPSQAQIL